LLDENFLFLAQFFPIINLEGIYKDYKYER